MPGSYMPSRQADAVLWSKNFALLVGGDPAALGVTEAQAKAYEAVNEALQIAYPLGTNPKTRTEGTVAAKLDALEAMKVRANELVTIIQVNPEVTDQQKRDLGLTIRKTSQTPVGVPKARPILKVDRTEGRTVFTRLQSGEARRGKPAGVAGATVFTFVGPAAPDAMGDWQFAGQTTRPTFEIPFAPSAVGDTVWVTAFWTNTKGQAGPSSRPISVNLPAGGVLPKEQAAKDEGGAKLKIAA